MVYLVLILRMIYLVLILKSFACWVKGLGGAWVYILVVIETTNQQTLVGTHAQYDYWMYSCRQKMLGSKRGCSSKRGGFSLSKNNLIQKLNNSYTTWNETCESMYTYTNIPVGIYVSVSVFRMFVQYVVGVYALMMYGVCMYVCMYVYVCLHVRVCVCMVYVCMYVCMYVCLFHVPVCLCIHSLNDDDCFYYVNSSLVSLIEGLCNWESSSRFYVHIFFALLFRKKNYANDKKKSIQYLIPPHTYIYTCVLCTHIRIHVTIHVYRDLVHLYSTDLPGVSSRFVGSHPSNPCTVCVCT